MSFDPGNAAPERGIGLHPHFCGAFRGLWSFTWKTAITLRKLPVLIVSIAGLPVLIFVTVDPGKTAVYLHWTIDFYLFLILPLQCLSVFGAMIRDDLQSDTLGFLTTRPLTRAQLFLTKYGCNLIWVEMMAGTHGLLLLAVGFYEEVPGIVTFAPLFLMTQFLAVAVYGALSALLGLLHQRYMVLGLIYGFLVEVGIGRIPTNINSLSMSHHMQTLLANHAIIAEQYDWVSTGTFKSLLIMLMATALFGAAGAMLFTFREFHATAEMQK